MKTLAVLVNFRTDQIKYLKQVVEGLQSFEKYDVDVIVHTNVNTGIEGIEERIYSLPNFQYLPLTCKETIWEYRNDYDLFIYGENDHLFKEIHLDKYLEYESILPEDRISGLMQYEINGDEPQYPAFHARYNWEYDTVEKHGGKLFAHFTNLHQATFILSKQMLHKIGAMHDFTQFFGSSHYSVKCKVNTDIYQFCGMKKLICIDEFEDNMIHHLPNLYINGENGRLRLGSYQKRMVDSLNKLKAAYNDREKI